MTFEGSKAGISMATAELMGGVRVFSGWEVSEPLLEESAAGWGGCESPLSAAESGCGV